MWWTRPLVRLAAALSLPFVVPAVITGVLWALPGDPAAIICPPQICVGTEALAARWGLDAGPWAFYLGWIQRAFALDFGNSWRVAQGMNVADLLRESLPATAELLLLALIPSAIGSAIAATGWSPPQPESRTWRPRGARVLLALSGLLPRLLWVLGLVPAVILALAAAAWVEIRYGALSHDGWPGLVRLILGGLVLAFADGAFAAAVTGTRTTFQDEFRQRYIGMAVLRGESPLENALPNVLPALAAQLRSRVLHLLSGTIVVEVVLGIPGLGELLFDGTLLQDFGVVLAAAWAFSALSAALMLAQALVEIAVALAVRRHPAVPQGAAT